MCCGNHLMKTANWLGIIMKQILSINVASKVTIGRILFAVLNAIWSQVGSIQKLLPF